MSDAVAPGEPQIEEVAPPPPNGPAEELAASIAGAEAGISEDDITWVRVPAPGVAEALLALRDAFGFERFVDMTCVDTPEREDRFELVYLVYSMRRGLWLRVKARTTGDAPSAVAAYPAINFYEREVYDLFGVMFSGHPNLKRIMLPDNWNGHPLRRDAPVDWEPIEFREARQEQYGD